MQGTPYVPPRHIAARDQAQLIRKALRAEFPDVKFSVRCSRGSAIRVAWTDGPTDGAVSAITSLYRGGGFDGMQDLRYDVQTILAGDAGPELVQFSADFVFTCRDYSQEALDIAATGIARLSNRPCVLHADPQAGDDWNTIYPVTTIGPDQQMTRYAGTEYGRDLAMRWLGVRDLTGITEATR